MQVYGLVGQTEEGISPEAHFIWKQYTIIYLLAGKYAVILT